MDHVGDGRGVGAVLLGQPQQHAGMAIDAGDPVGTWPATSMLATSPRSMGAWRATDHDAGQFGRRVTRELTRKL